MIITVAKAVLTKSFELFGKMSTYATVEWKNSEGGDVIQIAKTNTASKSHFTPVWNYTCKALTYSPQTDGGMTIILKIFDREKMGTDDFCGSCQISVTDLLEEPVNPPDHELPILLERKQTGVIYVSASLIESLLTEGRMIEKTTVDPSKFVTPVKRLGVSGGTAPFFSLVLANPDDGQSPNYYIGKDLDRSMDEILFYEALRDMKGNGDVAAKCFFGLFDYTFPYAGVLTAREDSADGPERELLVIRNLHDGCKKLRLLDFKIGLKTADAGWQGKSWLRAKKQQKMIDEKTNSSVEGFRLEGFDGSPENLMSMNPAMDGNALEYAMSAKDAEKKLRRRHFQKMNGTTILSYFTDLHQNIFSNFTSGGGDHLFKEEYAEIVLNEVVRRLSRLSVICHKVIVPQKWIGSSVALGFDAGVIPLRSKPESDVRNDVLVNLFDWGRSVLNTLETNKDLDPAIHKNYTKFWNSYIGGIDRLSWDTASYYFHRYGNSTGWESIRITLFDYDAMSADDEMGEVSFMVEETAVSSHSVKGGSRIFRAIPTIAYSLEWIPYPNDSRLQGVWSLLIVEAKGLPQMDGAGGKSDPYCKVTTSSANGHEYCQYTSVKENNLDPVWNETLEIPVMKESSFLQTSLEEAAVGLGGGNMVNMFTMKDEAGFNEWQERVKTADCGKKAD